MFRAPDPTENNHLIYIYICVCVCVCVCVSKGMFNMDKNEFIKLLAYICLLLQEQKIGSFHVVALLRS